MIKQTFNYLNSSRLDYFNKNKSVGFTLIELLVVISIIGFIAVSSMVIFNIVRMNSRDAVRAGNVATITRALAMYLNDSTIGYPLSNGECLSTTAGTVGTQLKTAKVLLAVPTDPLWPVDAPNPVPSTTPPYTTDNDGFCYYYVSDTYEFQIYYFLESNSKSGNAGPNMNEATQ